MSKHHLFITGLCLLGFACTPHLSPAQAPEKTPDPAVKRIEIKDFHFQPMALTVPRGTKIVFVNRDEEPHTVASVDGKFTRSKALDTDQEFTVTLTNPGDYGFFCTVHPTMTGKITVTAPTARP